MKHTDKLYLIKSAENALMRFMRINKRVPIGNIDERMIHLLEDASKNIGKNVPPSKKPGSMLDNIFENPIRRMRAGLSYLQPKNETFYQQLKDSYSSNFVDPWARSFLNSDLILAASDIRPPTVYDLLSKNPFNVLMRAKVKALGIPLQGSNGQTLINTPHIASKATDIIIKSVGSNKRLAGRNKWGDSPWYETVLNNDLQKLPNPPDVEVLLPMQKRTPLTISRARILASKDPTRFVFKGGSPTAVETLHSSPDTPLWWSAKPEVSLGYTGSMANHWLSSKANPEEFKTILQKQFKEYNDDVQPILDEYKKRRVEFESQLLEPWAEKLKDLNSDHVIAIKHLRASELMNKMKDNPHRLGVSEEFMDKFLNKNISNYDARTVADKLNMGSSNPFYDPVKEHFSNYEAEEGIRRIIDNLK